MATRLGLGGLALWGVFWSGHALAQQPPAPPADAPRQEEDQQGAPKPEAPVPDPPEAAPEEEKPVDVAPATSPGTDASAARQEAAETGAPGSTGPMLDGSRKAPATRAASSDHRPLVYTLEGISVRGNTRTRARVVLRYVPLSEGDVLDVDDPAVELIRYRLLGTGFFKSVELSLE
jgi:outer membrane protein insertion porin family